MLQPGRQFTAANNSTYRYGFNGKENDNDIGKGNGNQQDYGMRIYDPSVGRFLSVDPITKQYPELTPYQFASNTPIKAVDLDGLEAVQVSASLRGTFLILSTAVSVSVVAAPNGVSFYTSPEFGLGAGVGGGVGVSVAYYPSVKNSEQLGGWGFNAGGSFMGNGADISGSIQQDNKGKVTGVQFAGGLAVPKIGEGVGAEGHLTANYSFLIHTFTWQEIGDGLTEIANKFGIEPAKLTDMLKVAKQYLKEQEKNAVKSKKLTQKWPLNKTIVATRDKTSIAKKDINKVKTGSGNTNHQKKDPVESTQQPELKPATTF